MRQGQQQHRRGRNRSSNNNNNNRKGQNPLTRNFESSGPDVKIRGTPAHVAEKYMSLARDALSAGDPVLAENYLQHAEHYNRIILAFREQQVQPGDAPNGSGRPRDSSDDSEDGFADEASGDDQGRFIQPGDPQPTMSTGDAPRGGRGDGQRSQRARGHGSQGPRENREARGPREQREPREPREQREPREPREGREGGAPQREPRRRERQRFGESDQQPDFLRRPVRRPRSEESESAAESGDAPAPAIDVASDQD